MEPILLQHADIGYRVGTMTKIVAQGLDATLMPGELTCLIGRNGTGKSTLLRTLAGFQPLLAGTICYGTTATHDARHQADRQTLAKLIGVVLTDRPKLGNMSVSEVVALGRTPYTNFWGTLSPTDHEAVTTALRLTGIDMLQDRPVQSLSDGERQKVFIAKALAQETPVILLDEPTAFLDFQSKTETLALLHQLAHEQQKAILLSTHDLELALRKADRIWYMDGGQLHTDGRKIVEAIVNQWTTT
ncbi:MAG: ABC transporter ATP-binding protein [Prevotella sp.]|nr:ABC transporter ATP-binding protein [Prevotella sp.]